MSTTTADEVTGWVGWISFAGILMIMLGGLQAIVGLGAILEDDYWIQGVRDGQMLVLDLTQWGWVHLILGILVVIAGVSAMAGHFFGRTVGVLLALGVVFANLTYLRATPVWSVIAITLSVLIIWALTVHGREAQA